MQRHLGTFSGINHRPPEPPGSAARDLLSALAQAAFCLAVAWLACGVILPGGPA